jgi:FkbM family methyltransferase
MLKLVEIISFLLQKFTTKQQNKLFEIILKNIPIPLLQLIPCSYSAYIKKYRPQKGDVIMDCGAHIGNCTILFSRLVGKAGHVIAIEPFEESLKIFMKRTKNLKAKISIFKNGLWSENKKLPLSIFHDQTISCQIVNETEEVHDKNIQLIECRTIDHVISHINPDRLDLIKMDIEGAEIEALKGAVSTMSKYSPKFVIASYHIRNNEKTCFEVEKFLSERDYAVETFFSPHLTTYEERQNHFSPST